VRSCSRAVVPVSSRNGRHIRVDCMATRSLSIRLTGNDHESFSTCVVCVCVWSRLINAVVRQHGDVVIDRRPAANFVIPTRPVIKLARRSFTLSASDGDCFQRYVALFILWKSLFTIKNGSTIKYKTKQDNGNTYVKTEEHTKLHVSSILNKIIVIN